ncbi:MAG: hyaluronate lyase N-terminal domain-containing protein [Methylovirgula sp.]
MSEQLQLRRGTAAQIAAFTGAQGETVVDTTNNRLVVHDGATLGGFSAAKLSEVVTNMRTAVSDAAYTALPTDRLIAYTALTAARIVSLPAASAYPTGTPLSVVDESGSCSAANVVTLAANGTDTINGAASAVLSVPYAYIAIESNGSNKWTVLDQLTFKGAVEAQAVHGANVQICVVEDLITCSGAASVSTAQIPNRAIVLAVSVYVVAAITGATSYNVDATTSSGGGAGATGGQFGGGLGVAAGSNNVGVIGPTAWYAPSTITLTANGGSFTGGSVRIAIQYMLCASPNS